MIATDPAVNNKPAREYLAKRCPRCQSNHVALSHPRDARERLLTKLGYPPARCGVCFWRGSVKSGPINLPLLLGLGLLSLLVLCLVAFFLLWLFVLRGHAKSAPPVAVAVAVQPFTAAVPASAPVAVAHISPPPASAVVVPPVAKPVVDTKPIASAISAWADAWARRDVSAYLGCYAPTFKPSQGLSQAAWREQRTARISQAKSIKIGLSDMHIELIDSTHASARFRQEYAAQMVRDNGTKTLLLVKQGERWLIEQEKSGHN